MRIHVKCLIKNLIHGNIVKYYHHHHHYYYSGSGGGGGEEEQLSFSDFTVV